jgi:hypothetical protein
MSAAPANTLRLRHRLTCHVASGHGYHVCKHPYSLCLPLWLAALGGLPIESYYAKDSHTTF